MDADAHARRHAHRKRVSVARLSSDTLNLPLSHYSTYSSTSAAPWSRSAPSLIHPTSDSDLPPDYPDSAEEADEETDEVQDLPYSPPPPSWTSPRRKHFRRQPSHSAHHHRPLDASSSDPYLDALLARSVHALEMSNALLQSSMSTQTSLSAILQADSVADRTLEARARGLGSRIRQTRDAHAHWMDDLDEITKNVEGLFSDDAQESIPQFARFKATPAPEPKWPISQSLPSDAYMPTSRSRRRQSLDTPDRLLMIDSDRIPAIPPPRALTQYVSVESPFGEAAEMTADPDSILLPSTIGLRAPSSVSHFSDPSIIGTSATQMASPVSTTHRTPEPSTPTPAYNLLTSLSAQPKPRTSRSSSVSEAFRSTHQGIVDTIRDMRTRSRSPSSPVCSIRTARQRSTSRSRSRSTTPNQAHHSPTVPRPMTPTLEESSPSEDTSADEHRPHAKLTVELLKKILEDQQMHAPPSLDTGQRTNTRPRAPLFMPRTPAPTPTTQSSTTTTSISRLFTKGRHSSSTRAPSPPPHSSMKGRTRLSNLNPANGQTTAGIPSTTASPAASQPSARTSRTSSGTNSPRRISFAQLPESYTQSRGGSEGSLRLREKEKKRKRARAAAAAAKAAKSGGEGWWPSWFLPSSGGLTGTAEERVEDRFARGWGIRGGSGAGMDEWGL